MGADVTVVVSTFDGDPQYIEWAETRAIPSAKRQGVRVLHSHADTLAMARNAGLDAVETRWVILLDADDELERGYVDRMMEAYEATGADVIAPSVRYVRPSSTRSAPYIPNVASHRCQPCVTECLEHGNWIVIGALHTPPVASRFDEAFDLYEDWDYWLTLRGGGATFAAAPGAVYRAHMRRDSRNRSRSQAEKEAMHWRIHRKHFG